MTTGIKKEYQSECELVKHRLTDKVMKYFNAARCKDEQAGLRTVFKKSEKDDTRKTPLNLTGKPRLKAKPAGRLSGRFRQVQPQVQLHDQDDAALTRFAT